MHLEASRVSGLDEIVGRGQCRVYIIILRYIKLAQNQTIKTKKNIQEYKHFNTIVEPTLINCLPELFVGDKAVGE